MGSDKRNVEYLLIIVGLFIANIFCFLIILKSEEIIDEVRMSSAQDIIDYIIQVNDNEKNNAEEIFEYSNDNAIYAREQVLNNKELISFLGSLTDSNLGYKSNDINPLIFFAEIYRKKEQEKNYHEKNCSN